MYFITQPEARPGGFVFLSSSAEWVGWLARIIPQALHVTVRSRLISNLKHLLVGLELKKALIEPHHNRGPGDHEVLFEPYFQNFILEFCVAAFSVLEGLGSAQWLAQNDQDGANGPNILRNQWLPALAAVFDEHGEHGLEADINSTLAVRDKLHQDRLGARENIDWHAFSYENAFTPARRAIGTLLLREAEFVPAQTNLRN
jgi:hypothetical protein